MHAVPAPAVGLLYHSLYGNWVLHRGRKIVQEAVNIIQTGRHFGLVWRLAAYSPLAGLPALCVAYISYSLISSGIPHQIIHSRLKIRLDIFG